MVTAIDLGNPDNIHPREKRRLSARLANLALADCYGKPGLLAQSPSRSAVEISNGKSLYPLFECTGASHPRWCRRGQGL